jgi:hypothetical protein
MLFANKMPILNECVVRIYKLTLNAELLQTNSHILNFENSLIVLLEFGKLSNITTTRYL